MRPTATAHQDGPAMRPTATAHQDGPATHPTATAHQDVHSMPLIVAAAAEARS